MRWTVKHRHVGEFWKHIAILPKYCPDCETMLWLETYYRSKSTILCPSCLALRKLKVDECLGEDLKVQWPNLLPGVQPFGNGPYHAQQSCLPNATPPLPPQQSWASSGTDGLVSGSGASSST